MTDSQSPAAPASHNSAFPQIHRDENSLILHRDDGEDVLQIVVKVLLAKLQMRKRGELRSPPSVLTPPSSPSPLAWSPIQDRRDLNKQQNS